MARSRSTSSRISNAGAGSFFNNFLSLFLLLLLLHLGCFIFLSNNNPPSKKNKKHQPSPSRLGKPEPLSSSWSFLKRIFSSSSPHNSSKAKTLKASPSHASIASVTSSTSNINTNSTNNDSNSNLVSSARSSQQYSSLDRPHLSSESYISVTADHNHFFPLRNDIFPCTACGQIFQKPHLLEQHQSVKHAVSELIDGDSGKNIVDIIFRTGWSNRHKSPVIHRILKIRNSSNILSRFEEYREFVKAKAARNNGGVRKRDERCKADGNEQLRFCCSTFVCDLGQQGNSSICSQVYCSVCGIIKSGFSAKLDGISTQSSSWRAHVAIPDEIEEEFEFMNVRRAMLVCRVVAGRVGRDEDQDDVAVAKENGGFDSVVGGVQPRDVVDDDEELLVFNPRAVLPCFVVVYSTVPV